MKKITFIIVAVLIAGNCFSQVPNWAWGKQPIGNSFGSFVSASSSGSVYVTGSFSGATLTFGSTIFNNASTNLYDADMFIAKYDCNGNLQWAQSAGGTGGDGSKSIIADDNGNVYVLGNYLSPTITFGSITLTTTNTINPYEESFLVKYDSTGVVIWAKNVGAGGYGLGLTVDATGVYYTGWFINPSMIIGNDTLIKSLPDNQNNWDFYVAKFDLNGNPIWARGAGGRCFDVGNSIATDGNGNVLVTGYFKSDTIIFGNDTLMKTGDTLSDRIFIVKYNSSGTELWAKSPAGYIGNYGNAIATDDSGIYITGYCNGSMVVFGNDTLYPGEYLAKYDSTGSVLWANGSNFPISSNAYGNSVTTDPTGVYLVGYFTGDSITFGNFTIYKSGTSSFANGFIVKYNKLGVALWAKGVDGINNEGYITSVSTNGRGTYITGWMDSSAPCIFGSDTLYNSNNNSTILAKLSKPNNVWPGDADNNSIVDNTDLLPIGLYYGQMGFPRNSISNVWQGDTCTNWGTLQVNQNDIKYVDCNGDGTIDNNDTMAVNLNFNLVHAITQNHNINQEKTNSPDIYFVTSTNIYHPGDMIDVQVWAGNAITPVNNLYGIAFNVNYNSSFVQPGTESLAYSASWLGTPGTDAIKIGKIDALVNTAYGAETRINHANASGYGKIADFKFQANTSITSTSVLHLSVSNYKANDSAGVAKVFNTINDSLIIYVSGAGINEVQDNSGIVISPNPFTTQTTITFSEEHTSAGSATHTIRVVNVLGEVIQQLTTSNKQLTLDMSGVAKGIYFVKIEDEKKNVVNRKIVVE